jgi:hypothetical protein
VNKGPEVILHPSAIRFSYSSNTSPNSQNKAEKEQLLKDKSDCNRNNGTGNERNGDSGYPNHSPAVY